MNAKQDKLELNLAIIGHRHRRIFDIQDAEKVFISAAREVCDRYSVTVKDAAAGGDMAALVLLCPLATDPGRLSFRIRKQASSALREAYPELAHVPQIFSGKTWSSVGEMTAEDAASRRDFVDSL